MNQLNALARVLEPTKPKLLDYILGQPVIGADETTLDDPANPLDNNATERAATEAALRDGSVLLPQQLG